MYSLSKILQNITNSIIIYDNTFHDRYFIIDDKIVYHCGTSINGIGYKTFSINLISDDEGNIKVEVLLKNEDVWLNIEALATLFNIDRSGIVRHIKNIYNDEELSENSTCAKIAHVGNDGKQTYNTKYYNLDMIISIGFRVNFKKAIKFRTWANKIIKEYLIKGYNINVERFKNNGNDSYFGEFFDKIRDIRSSEKFSVKNIRYICKFI